MAQKNIYNPTTGQYGFQVPGSALQSGWQWVGQSSPTLKPVVSTATPVSSTPAVPTNTGSSQNNVAALNAAREAAVNAGKDPYAGNISSLSAFNANPTMPSTVSNPSTPASNPTPAPVTPSTYNGTDNEILKQLLESMKPTQEETDLAKKISDTQTATEKSFVDIEGQPVAVPFITGQKAAVQKSSELQLGGLQRQMVNLQAKRQASIDASKAVLDYNKPMSVSMGSNLVNPITGKTVASGQSYSSKLGTNTLFDWAKQFPDAGVDPYSDDISSAAMKVENSASFRAKYVGFQIDPFTGQIIQTSKYSAAGGTPRDTSVGGGTAPSGGSNFGVPSTPAVQSLDIGSNGESVRALQNWLISQGYNIPAGATGYYGDQTKAAVAAFQRASGVDLSGGGEGTFGPRTQAAATQKGFGSTGGAPSVSTPAETTSPTSTGQNANLIPVQLKSALQNVGGFLFLDGSNITSSQMPFAQRASVTSGIPLLDKSDSDKVKTSYQTFVSANSLVTELSDLSTKVLTAPNDPIEMSAQAARLKLIETAPTISTDNNAKAFLKARDALLSLITRAAGEKGTLTDRDVLRIQNALPSLSDNSELAKQKSANLTSVLESVFSGSVEAYLQGRGIGSGTGTNTGSDNEYQRYIQSIK